jgi:hypothetical protein
VSDGYGVFAAMSAEWSVLIRTRGAQRAFARWTMVEPVLSGDGSIGVLVERCHRRGESAAAAARLAALLRLADDPLAARTVLQALVPGLARLVSRVNVRRSWLGVMGAWPTLDDAAADVVTAAVHTIDAWAGRTVEWPQTMVLDRAWDRTMAVVQRWRRWGCGQVELPLPDVSLNPAHELASLLSAAVERGRVSLADAELIWRYRVGDEPATLVALERQCSPVGLRARRSRAERVLAQMSWAS